MDKDKTIERKKRVVLIGDSMLNGILKKGMPKNHKQLKVNNFPSGTSAKILKNMDQLIRSKPGCPIVHAQTNDLTNKTNLLNQGKKNSEAKLKRYPKIPKLCFKAL